MGGAVGMGKKMRSWQVGTVFPHLFALCIFFSQLHFLKKGFASTKGKLSSSMLCSTDYISEVETPFALVWERASAEVPL